MDGNVNNALIRSLAARLDHSFLLSDVFAGILKKTLTGSPPMLLVSGQQATGQNMQKTWETQVRRTHGKNYGIQTETG